MRATAPTGAGELRTTCGGRFAIAPAAGCVTVERGRGWRRLVAAVLGFPGPGTVPVRLDISPGPVEVWTRRFGSRRVRTRVELIDGGLSEALGPVVIELAHPDDAAVDRPGPDGCLVVTCRRWGLRLAGRTVPLPTRYRPRIRVVTRPRPPGLQVEVRVADHRDRPITAYRGLLRPAMSPSRGRRVDEVGR